MIRPRLEHKARVACKLCQCCSCYVRHSLTSLLIYVTVNDEECDKYSISFFFSYWLRDIIRNQHNTNDVDIAYIIEQHRNWQIVTLQPMFTSVSYDCLLAIKYKQLCFWNAEFPVLIIYRNSWHILLVYLLKIIVLLLLANLLGNNERLPDPRVWK